MILYDLINLAFPSCCYYCDNTLETELYVCNRCLGNIKKTNYHQIPKRNELYTLLNDPEINGAFSMYYYEESGILQRLIYKLKYNHKKNIGIWMGEIYGKILQREYICNFDYIIPVPLHKSKESLRGYNQSKMIAIGLNKYISGCINDNSLIKIRDTASQTLKNKNKRRTDIIGSFRLMNAELLNNKNILLVDDIITSGSTILECIKTIKEGVNCNITVCSIGRTR